MDTPGHVDFSAETERVLQVLDYAILVISGLDGVQAHTRTLWKLLGLYNVPTVVFVTKMDFARYTEEDILKELKSELDSSIVGMNSPDFHEQFAMCREDLLDKYLETGEIDINDIAQLTKSRLSFPCFFGSGLKVQGVDEFLETQPVDDEIAEADVLYLYDFAGDSVCYRVSDVADNLWGAQQCGFERGCS